MSHTPTPWKGTADGLSVTVRSADRELPIAEMWENGDNPSENAAFIVKACNAHDGLVAALQSANKFLMAIKEIDPVHIALFSHAFDDVRAALAKAGAYKAEDLTLSR